MGNSIPSLIDFFYKKLYQHFLSQIHNELQNNYFAVKLQNCETGRYDFHGLTWDTVHSCCAVYTGPFYLK